MSTIPPKVYSTCTCQIYLHMSTLSPNVFSTSTYLLYFHMYIIPPHVYATSICAFYILARRIFLKIILADSAALKQRWPVDVSEILTMYLIAENLVNHWDVIKVEFKQTKTLAQTKTKTLIKDEFKQTKTINHGNCAMIHSPRRV